MGVIILSVLLSNGLTCNFVITSRRFFCRFGIPIDTLHFFYLRTFFEIKFLRMIVFHIVVTRKKLTIFQEYGLYSFCFYCIDNWLCSPSLNTLKNLAFKITLCLGLATGSHSFFRFCTFKHFLNLRRSKPQH